MSGQRADGGQRVELLGPPVLHGAGGQRVRLERKAAAVLALLAVEGEVPRGRLATLLWPHAPDVTARANLRQMLRRARTGGLPLDGTGEGVLRLPEALDVDLLRLQAQARAGRFAEASATAGELLEGHAYDDCPELEAWVRAQQLALTELRQRAASEQAARQEAEGQGPAALEWNRRLLELDPGNEEAHRRAMRLLLAQGDRAGALRAWARCRAALEGELGVTPSAETRALGRQVEGGGAAPGGPAQPSPVPVMRALRPRTLAGREAAWEQLHQAWQTRQAAFVVGEAGSGRTRLLHDFAASRRERVLFLEAHPLDRAVPYATLARLWRVLLERCPPGALPAWAQRSLARLLPELAEGEGAPREAPGESDALRLLQAQGELLRVAAGDVALLVCDDLHHADRASAEALLHGLLAAPAGAGASVPRLVASLRAGGSAHAWRGAEEAAAGAGLAVRVELGELDEAAVGVLLAGLDVPGGARRAASVLRHASGNPLLVVETARGLLSADTQQSASALPASPRARQVLAGRLEGLSPGALQLARALALLDRGFSLERAEAGLGLPSVPLAAAWDELLAARVVQPGGGFTSVLLARAVAQATPPPVRQWLEERLAPTAASPRAAHG
jgi:DNA-binding SARP family transcriptional activator